MNKEQVKEGKFTCPECNLAMVNDNGVFLCEKCNHKIDPYASETVYYSKVNDKTNTTTAELDVEKITADYYINRLIDSGTTLYKITGIIGSGGMSTVYKGVQESLNREVAVKILHRRHLGKKEMVSRFENEARVLSALYHPNIIGVYDFGKLNGVPYIVEEYLQGSTLKEFMRSVDKISFIFSLKVCLNILNAIEYSHAKGIIHRDISPMNVIVDHESNTKMIDFGLCKAPAEIAGTRMTTTGTVMGTMAYSAPEQIDMYKGDAKRVDHRGDIYSLGIIFYEMITGNLPEGVNFPMPSSVSSEIPKEFDSIILRAIERNPEDRYQHARDMIRDIMMAAEAIKSEEEVYDTSFARKLANAALASSILAIVFFIIFILLVISN